MKTSRALKASRSLREGFAKASRRRHGRLHLETIRQIMTSPLPNTHQVKFLLADRQAVNYLIFVTVCVCVFFPSILDINGRTSRGHTGVNYLIFVTVPDVMITSRVVFDKFQQEVTVPVLFS